jgi:hypothetical protein
MRIEFVLNVFSSLVIHKLQLNIRSVLTDQRVLAGGRALDETILRKASQELRTTIEQADISHFHSTTYQDVLLLARVIENEQGKCQRLRNLRRIQPFLNILKELSIVIESLCHDKTYINYIWVL